MILAEIFDITSVINCKLLTVKASLGQFIFSLLVGFPGIVREEFLHVRGFLQCFVSQL